jgi:hypothetical protein
MSGLDHAAAAGHVREDLVQGLAQFSIDDFSYDEGVSAAAGVETVVWEARAHLVHDFLGAPPSTGEVVIRGVTLVREGDGGVPVFRRFIDWLDLLNALGLNGVMRPVQVQAVEQEPPPA